ncbi:MAG TPA: MFS transporter, partial [Gemmatimonadaceae bacterium]|nr:MFS transporter [Gemmatimonadaceae bacterium]
MTLPPETDVVAGNGAPPVASVSARPGPPDPSLLHRRDLDDAFEPPATIGTVLARPRFAFLVVGQTVSQLGDKLHHMALIALVGAGAAQNAGGLELAKLSVVFTAPVVLFGPVAGSMVDRWNKRHVMIACDALRTILVGSIPALFAATGELWPVYFIAFLVFLLGVFFNAAKMALIPELVPRAHLLPANAALTFVGRFATVAGIVGGGVIIGIAFWRRFGWSDYAAGFYLDAASYLISVLSLVGIVALGRGRGTRGFRRPAAPDAVLAAPSSPAGAPPHFRVKRSIGTVVRDVVRTVAVIRHDRSMRFVFGTLVALSLF